MAKLDNNGEREEREFPSLPIQQSRLDDALEAVWGMKADPKPSGEPSAKNIPNFDDMRLMP